MKRTNAVGGVLLVALLIASDSVYIRMQNRLKVANTSGQAISELAITVGGETIRFVNAPPGAVATGTFPICSGGNNDCRVLISDC